MSARVWQKKQDLFSNGSVTFVTCSRWLEAEAKQSALLKSQKITNIPNPINTQIYKVDDRSAARRQLGLPQDRQQILFVSQRATNPGKGMNYLVEACNLLVSQYPDMKERTEVIILGGHADEVVDLLPFNAHALGYVNDEHSIAKVYAAADVFVLPSLSENLPNTIMEAMACGVPCIGFKVGGIPEEIDHLKNGYVAAYRDAGDLAKGLYWVLCEADREALGRAAVSKVSRSYSQQSVALRYTEVYNEAIAQKGYSL